MTWSKPDFVQISLNMEVTGYVNTDEALSDVTPKRSPKDATEKRSAEDASEKRS